MDVRQMIKQAVTTIATVFTGPFPRSQAKYNDKTTDFMPVIPYGLISNPPPGSHVVLLSLQGQESAKVGIVSNFEKITQGDVSGETGLRNVLTDAFIRLNTAGGVEVDAIAGTVTINSMVIELGSLTTQTLVNALFMTAIYAPHTHQESGGGTTGVPNQQGVPGTHTTTETKAS